jgi:hypothetical protein
VLDVLSGDVEMGDRAEHVSARGEGEQDTLGAQAGNSVVRREPEPTDVDEDEVRLDLLEVDR